MNQDEATVFSEYTGTLTKNQSKNSNSKYKRNRSNQVIKHTLVLAGVESILYKETEKDEGPNSPLLVGRFNWKDSAILCQE